MEADKPCGLRPEALSMTVLSHTGPYFSISRNRKPAALLLFLCAEITVTGSCGILDFRTHLQQSLPLVSPMTELCQASVPW